MFMLAGDGTCAEEATDVAVRSSATAEDLPGASFAGQQETFLNVRGGASVVLAVRRAFASLFTPRAISYRMDMGFDWRKVAISVGVQKMVRSDLASAGVMFTLDPDTGHRGFILVTSSFGLGESVVQGKVIPDQFYIHKPTLAEGRPSIVWKKLGAKEERLVYDTAGHKSVRVERVAEAERATFSLTDEDVLVLARWAAKIEEHYSRVRGAETPPSNILLAERFARIFDGFSVGSNDLTQLTLGVDRDSPTVAPLFDERNEAVKWSCRRLVEAARAEGRKVGICGQAPSDYPDFAAFLVPCGIDSISLSPDALVRTILRVREAEEHVERLAAGGKAPNDLSRPSMTAPSAE